MVNDLSVF